MDGRYPKSMVKTNRRKPMGLSKLKQLLESALKVGDAKLAKKTKDGLRKAREWKPLFKGAHRGF
jgi:hypothetical protein